MVFRTGNLSKLMLVAVCLCSLIYPAWASYGSGTMKKFLPAPPGERPPCAKEGETYCDEVYYYPGELIRYLLDNYEYDFDTLINSESKDASPTSIPPARLKIPASATESLSGEAVFIPGEQLPIVNASEQINTLRTEQSAPQRTAPKLPAATPAPPPQTPANQAPIAQVVTNQGLPRPAVANQVPPRQVLANRDVSFQPAASQASFQHAATNQTFSVVPSVTTWTPKVRSYEQGGFHGVERPSGYHPRSDVYTYTSGTPVKPEAWLQSYTNPKPFSHRSARQAVNEENSLCPTRTQFAIPKAAVNTKGNWMFVVNVNGGNNELTQLVKTEKCATAQCSGLCTVPQGFTATCQQQFVQKRLVALNGDGDSLYHDVFWFPHCCICQVRQANG